WGGVIATKVAALFPERVRSLVLADSTRGSGRTAEGAERMRERVRALSRLGAERFAAERAPRLAAPDAPAAALEALAAGMAAVRLPGYAAAAEMMATTDTSPLLGRVSCPTLVLVGEHDEVTGVAESRVLADAIPGARLAVIPDAGHAAIQERPE